MENVATAKQISFIKSLVSRKGTTFTPEGVDLTSDAELESMPRWYASKTISALLALKDAPAPVARSTAQATQTAVSAAPVAGLDLSPLRGGYYAATVDGVTKFFKIDRVTEGKWAGWTFVKIQASDDLHRQGSQKPGEAYKGSSADYLELIVADEHAALALYGHEIGRCGVCGRTLTDEQSRERGIGPVCWDKMGY